MYDYVYVYWTEACITIMKLFPKQIMLSTDVKLVIYHMVI